MQIICIYAILEGRKAQRTQRRPILVPVAAAGVIMWYNTSMTGRYSKKREEILTRLKSEHGALSAAEIHSKLPAIDLTTIYRNLDRFVAEGKVKRLSLHGNEALYEYQTKPHHHAVCTECERVIHFTAPDDELKALLGVKDFQVDEIEVTVRGICKHTR